jgi:hypothetical protein
MAVLDAKKTYENLKSKGFVDSPNRSFFYLLSLVGLLFLLFWGLPDSILYAKGGIMRWLPLFLIFFLLPILLYKILMTLRIDYVWSLSVALGSIFIVGPAFGFWTGYLSDLDLEKYGKKTTGIISEKWKSKNTWLFKATFKVDGIEYKTFTQTESENIYHIGSFVTVKFSIRNPENNTVEQ